MDADGHVNEVRLVGRLAAEPVRRQLPSGDEIVTFRLVVRRSAAAVRAAAARAGASGRAPTVDTLECTAWRKDAQRALGRAAVGDVLDVSGALRRRFWRSPSGPASRADVEVVSVRQARATV